MLANDRPADARPHLAAIVAGFREYALAQFYYGEALERTGDAASAAAQCRAVLTWAAPGSPAVQRSQSRLAAMTANHLAGTPTVGP
jgi:hypothetical protein